MGKKCLSMFWFCHTGHFNTLLMIHLLEAGSPIKTAFSQLNIFTFQDDYLFYNFSPKKVYPSDHLIYFKK